MQKYFFHSILVAFVVGVALQSYTDFHWALLVWLIVVTAALIVWWGRKSFAFSTPLFLCTITIACALGAFRMEVVSSSFGNSPLQSQLDEEVSLSGVVVREPDIRESSTHLYVNVNDDVVLVTTDRYSMVQYGDEVAVTGTLAEPETFTTELGREFNYPGYLLARGVEYTVSFAEVETVKEGQGNPVIAFLLTQKHALMTAIETVLPEPQAGLGEGLLLGAKQALGEELEAAFRTTGIIHIVVLSGYNIMLVVAFIMMVLSFVLAPRARAFVGIGAIVCFALMVGLSATVVRASVMASLFLIAQAFGRTYDILRALLFAGAIMIAFNPYLLLYDIGFQFSFMATLGLVCIAPRFESMLTERIGLLHGKEYFIATIATQIAVLPLLMYYMGEVSLVAVVVNVLVLPMVPVAMLLTFFTGILALFIPALPVAFLAHLSLSYIVVVATWFATLPFAAVTIPTFPPIAVFLSYAGIALFVWWLKRAPASSNEFKDWVIEEESDTKVGVELRSSPTKPDLPIFFR